MPDIFDTVLLCEDCDRKTKKLIISRNGFNLRAWQCPSCEKTWYHPSDQEEYENFQRLRNKTFEVKLRLVGNSYTISIPREIIEFEREMQKHMNEIIRLTLEDPSRLTIFFSNKRKVY